MDLDRRVKRGRERLAQEVEPAPAPPLSAEKSEQLSVLEEKIKNLLEQAEALGEAGKVDEAEALMRKVLLLFSEFFSIEIPLISCIAEDFSRKSTHRTTRVLLLCMPLIDSLSYKDFMLYAVGAF